MDVPAGRLALTIFIALSLFMGTGAAADGKVLVIGLDGADWDVVRPLVEDGEMPNLAALMDGGRSGNLTTTLPIESPVAWTSLTTGTTPGKHGIYGFLERDGDEFVPTTGNDVRVDRVWDRTGAAGEAVIVNVPQTFPPQPLNGSLISSYLSIKEAGYTYPAELQDELEDRNYSIEVLDERFQQGSEDRFLDRLDGTVKTRTAVATDLLDRHDWTLGIVVYTGIDRLQHYFWGYHRDGDATYGDAITDHYRMLDEQIGTLVERAGEDTTVMVVSDHGFGELKGNVHLNTWLRQEGYLALDREHEEGLLSRLGLTQQRVVDVLGAVGLLGPATAVAEFLGFNPGTSLPSPDLSSIDWERTEAYAGNYGGKVYLTGNVPPDEREAMRQELAEGLMGIEDPRTGEAVFADVHRPGDIYTGEMDGAPDLVVEPAGPYRAVGFLGHRDVVQPAPVKTGTHRQDGIYVVSGSGAAGTGDGEIIDVAPTILDALNVSVPDGMDGTSLLR